jgi:hypothetical protein
MRWSRPYIGRLTAATGAAVEQARYKKGTRFHGRVEHPDGRPCARPGCKAPGEFKAPPRDAREAAARAGGDWQWLCLDHVREFNARYNFFDGMSPEEISDAQSPHPSWDRATRAFASNAYAEGLRDPHGIFGRAETMRARTPSGRPLSDADRRALRELDLEPDATRADLRKRYAELVRAYHPDRNGGDRAHEGKLRRVIDAYTHLKTAAAFAA